MVVVLFGCAPEAPAPSASKAPGASDPSAEPAPGYDAAALRAVWRDSVRYRSAKLALANNQASLAADLEKAKRMLEVTEAYQRLPVVADPSADAAAVEALLRGLLATLRAPGEVRVVPASLGPTPSGERSTEEGVRYTEEQLAPRHQVTLTLANGLVDGPRCLRALKQQKRMVIIESVRLDQGAAILTGGVAFFRDLKPVRFVVPPRDPDALVTAVTQRAPSALDASGQALAEKIRANHAQVEAAGPALAQALAHEAELAIVQPRFQLYARQVDAFNKVSWTGLLRGEGEKGEKAGTTGDGGHPPH